MDYINKKLVSVLDIPEGCCCYCGRRMNNIAGHKYRATIDHVIPKSRGGLNVSDNRIPSCRHCNEMKDCKSLTFFSEQIKGMLGIGSHRDRKRYDLMYKNILLIKVEVKKNKWLYYARPSLIRIVG